MYLCSAWAITHTHTAGSYVFQGFLLSSGNIPETFQPCTGPGRQNPQKLKSPLAMIVLLLIIIMNWLSPFKVPGTVRLTLFYRWGPWGRGWREMEKYLVQGQTANSSTGPVCTTSQWSKRLWDLRAQSGGNYKPFLYGTFISLKGLRRRNSTNSGEQIPRFKYQLHHLWFGGGMTLG